MIKLNGEEGREERNVMSTTHGSPKTPVLALFSDEVVSARNVVQCFVAWAAQFFLAVVIFDYGLIGEGLMKVIETFGIPDSAVYIAAVPIATTFLSAIVFSKYPKIRGAIYEACFGSVVALVKGGIGVVAGAVWGFSAGALLRHFCWNTCSGDLVIARHIFCFLPLWAFVALIVFGVLNIGGRWLCDDLAEVWRARKQLGAPSMY